MPFRLRRAPRTMRSLIEGIWTDEVFDAVRVDLDAPVGQEGLRSVPMAVELGPVFTEACFGRDAQALVLQPFPKSGDRRGGPGPACREALAGGRAAEIFLDGIGFSDPAAILEPSRSNTSFSLRRAWAQQCATGIGSGSWQRPECRRWSDHRNRLAQHVVRLKAHRHALPSPKGPPGYCRNR